MPVAVVLAALKEAGRVMAVKVWAPTLYRKPCASLAAFT